MLSPDPDRSMHVRFAPRNEEDWSMTKHKSETHTEGTVLPFSLERIEQVPLATLKEYDRQTRSRGDRAIVKLAASIERFGFVVPVLAEADGTIIAGHGRVAAAKRLGMECVPVAWAGHLAKAEARALRIADNRLAELSEWDRDALRIEFEDLSGLVLAGDLDLELEITGFEMPEIDVLLTATEDQGADAATEIVEAPDPATPTITRSGDLWQCGRHRLLCGSALEAGSYDRLLGGDLVRMIFTDPPYNVPVNGHVRSGAGGHREFAMASGEMTDAEFRAFLATAFGRFMVVLIPGGIAMVCMDWRHIEELIQVGKAGGFELINLCVWNKSNGGMGSLYRSKHELVAIFRRPGASHVNNVELGRHGRNRTNVWDYAGVNSFGAGRKADLADHPTVKPTALVADAILDVSQRGDLVLDTFAGSGASLLAAEQTGRAARLIELDPAYCDVAIRRWQEKSGQAAILVATGETFAAREASCLREADDGETAATLITSASGEMSDAA